MTGRALRHRTFRFAALLTLFLFGITSIVAAQDETGRIQRIAGKLDAGEVDVYLLQDLQAGDRLVVSMRTTSGNLDPAIGVVDTSVPMDELIARFRADVVLLTEADDVSLALNDLRDQYFLAWDDDSGGGYAAALEYVIPAAGDHMLVAAGSLSSLGRATFGDYELIVGLNPSRALGSESEPVGAPIAERVTVSAAVSPAVEETSGTITAERPIVNLRLAEFEPGDTLYTYVEPTSGNMIPALILRDYGGKAVQASNLTGQAAQATLEYMLPEGGVGYSIDVLGSSQAEGGATTGDFRLLVGVNAPDVLTGEATPQGDQILQAPIEVQVGIRINRISAVNSQDENYNIIGNIRMDWSDPALAFSPDTCNCSVKLYTEKEFDRFLADVGSKWPDFSFFNQLGNRWVQSRVAAIWPDGSARYAEAFSTIFQSDFDFRKYPFDTQQFPIYMDLILPADVYTLTELPGYSGIDPAHGEDEFIITDFTISTSVETASAADRPVSRLTFNFNAPRHLNYYVLQVFVPIILIILISWFTFFLKDYGRRIEAAAANILLFIAFNFSLSDNYPRLGYVTFLDAIMAVTFVVNALVLLYNVNMKRLENKGESARVERVDAIFDWLYPLLYLALVGFVALFFF